jgi:GT2 family glycosyltransferase
MYDRKLSVIVVPHERRFPPEPCLYSLRAAADGLDAEIFFASGDPEGTLPSHFPEITFPEKPRETNDVQFVNRILAECKGEYVLMLHPDTVIGEDCLRTLCCFMDEHADAGAAGVKMLDGQGVFMPESRRRFPSPRTLSRKLYAPERPLPDSKRSVANDSADRRRRVDAVSDAFVMFNRNALTRTGLPDDSFPSEGAYLDIMYRMAAAGYGTFYIPEERILHCGGVAARRGDRKHICASYDALSLFCKKYYPEAKTTAFLIGLRKRHALLFEREKKRQKPGKRRLLAFCRETHLPEIKTAAKARLSGISDVGLWNIDRNRPVEATSDRRIKMQSYTDMAFCYPDISFGQILLFMDKMMEKNIVYHIYLPVHNQFISYETV